MNQKNTQAYWKYVGSDGEALSKDFLSPPPGNYNKIEFIAFSKGNKKIVRKPLVFICNLGLNTIYSLIYSLSNLLNINTKTINIYEIENGNLFYEKSTFMVVIDDNIFCKNNNLNPETYFKQLKNIQSLIRQIIKDEYNTTLLFVKEYEINKIGSQIIPKFRSDLIQDPQYIFNLFVQKINKIYQENRQLNLCKKINDYIKILSESKEYKNICESIYTIYRLFQYYDFNIVLYILLFNLQMYLEPKKHLSNKWSCLKNCKHNCGIRNLRDLSIVRQVLYISKFRPFEDALNEKGYNEYSLYMILIYLTGVVCHNNIFKINNKAITFSSNMLILLKCEDYNLKELDGIFSELNKNYPIIKKLSNKNIISSTCNNKISIIYDNSPKYLFAKLIIKNHISQHLLELITPFNEIYKSNKPKPIINIFCCLSIDILNELYTSPKIKNSNILKKSIFLNNQFLNNNIYSEVREKISIIEKYVNISDNEIHVHLQDNGLIIDEEILKICEDYIPYKINRTQLTFLKNLFYRLCIISEIINKRDTDKRIIIYYKTATNMLNILEYYISVWTSFNFKFGNVGVLIYKIINYINKTRKDFYYESQLKKNFAQSTNNKKIINIAITYLIFKRYLLPLETPPVYRLGRKPVVYKANMSVIKSYENDLNFTDFIIPNFKYFK